MIKIKSRTLQENKKSSFEKIFVSIAVIFIFILIFKAVPSSSLTVLADCQDGKDNDNDGFIDYPRDPGCSSSEDTTEIAEITKEVCEDGKDNDLDGFIDYPTDIGCTSPEDSFETNNIACNDGMDNDNDGFIDYPRDPTCQSYSDISEGTWSKKNGPDLIVTNIKAYRLATSTGFTWGKYYGITAVFKNIGTIPVTHPFNVIINTPKSKGMYHTYYNEQRINQKYVGVLGFIEAGKLIMPGEEVAASVYWVPLYEGQVYEISSIVDSKSEISETDENNNKLVKRFVIEVGLGGLENVRALD